jgi:hypothetical protein
MLCTLVGGKGPWNCQISRLWGEHSTPFHQVGAALIRFNIPRFLHGTRSLMTLSRPKKLWLDPSGTRVYVTTVQLSATSTTTPRAQPYGPDRCCTGLSLITGGGHHSMIQQWPGTAGCMVVQWLEERSAAVTAGVNNMVLQGQVATERNSRGLQSTQNKN